MKKTRILSLLLLASVFATASCGGGSTDDKETSPSGGETTTSAEQTGYKYPDKNFNGKEFTVMNYSNMWECVMALDFAEQTGDRLDDAIYNRNRKVEEKLGFRMNEVATEYPGWSALTTTIDQLMTGIMAGDKTYDAAYIPISFKPGLVTEGYLYDLYQLPGMNLSEEWWDQAMVNSLTIDGKLFAVSSPLHLMALDMSWVTLFNQDMMDDMKIEYPYQLVRDGKWTIDKWNEYVTKAASLNGDDSFTYSKDGKATYGIAHHPTAIEGMIYAAGNELVVNGKNGYELNLESERLYNSLEKIYKLLDKTNGNREGGTDSNQANFYYSMFRESRAMFLTCELKSASVMRDMDATFGLLPYPKYDESQENYQTLMNASSCLLTVPNNIEDPEFTGIVLDALSYESLQSVLPEYYDVSLSQKGLRNDESIEMLQIIRNTRGIEFARIFGVTTSLLEKLRALADSGSDTYVSVIASNKAQVAENLQKLLDSLN